MNDTRVIIDHKITAIIWDLDGTLLDSFEVYSTILAEAVMMHNLPMPERQVLLNNYHGSLADSIAAALSLSDEGQLATLVADFLKVQEKFYAAPDSHLFADAIALAERFGERGYKQFIVTNRAHAGRGSASPRFIAQHSRLRPFVSDIVCGDDTPYAKPDARVLTELLDRHTLLPENVLVIGDQHVDADLAHNCGSDAIIVSRSSAALSRITARPGLQIVTSLDAVSVE